MWHVAPNLESVCCNLPPCKQRWWWCWLDLLRLLPYQQSCRGMCCCSCCWLLLLLPMCCAVLSRAYPHAIVCMVGVCGLQEVELDIVGFRSQDARLKLSTCASLDPQEQPTRTLQLPTAPNIRHDDLALQAVSQPHGHTRATTIRAGQELYTCLCAISGVYKAFGSTTIDPRGHATRQPESSSTDNSSSKPGAAAACMAPTVT